MNWKEYLKSQGFSDAEIANMETTFGADKMGRAFQQAVADKVAAEKALADARTAEAEQTRWYETEVLPKVGQTYQDAINWRTRASAAEERLRAAREYGFLSDEGALPVVPGTAPGAPLTNPVPGSPAPPASVTSTGTVPGSAPGTTLDPRYVPVEAFKRGIDEVPDMWARMQNVSNQHFALFGNLDLDMTQLLADARQRKTNIQTVWEERYKVKDKREEIARLKQEAHDKEVADKAVRDFASTHNMPFTAPGVISHAPLFSPKQGSSEDMHRPWKGSKERKAERRETMLEAMRTGRSAGAGTGTPGTRVQ